VRESREMCQGDCFGERGSVMDAKHLPNVIILTDGVVNLEHGTGTSLIRHFSSFPPHKLLNLFWLGNGNHGAPAFENALRVRVKARPRQAQQIRTLKDLLQMGKHWTLDLARRAIRLLRPGDAINPSELRSRIEGMGFSPDIVYATCFGQPSLRILSELLHQYGGELPAIQHFLDYFPDLFEGSAEQELQSVAPSLSEIWSLTRSLADEIAPQLGREVRVVNTFCDELPAGYKTEHREYGPDFAAVIMGNIWRPDILDDLFEAWNWAGRELDGLRPIEWMCHPRSLDRLRREGVNLGPEIQPVGFFQGAELQEKLRHADMTIIPLNREAYPETDYARFSLPSRITEIAAAGLPVFLAASPDTETARYVEEHGIGVVATPADKERFRETLLTFIQDRDLRAECGRRARALAEREFDIDRYRNFLYGKLAEHARRKVQ
jgi:glycosyltransferase involved in cell wall biosynthesis